MARWRWQRDPAVVRWLETGHPESLHRFRSRFEANPHDSDLVVDPPGALDRQLGFLERLDGEIEAFVEEGRLREGDRSGGAWYDKVVMGLFAHELRD